MEHRKEGGEARRSLFGLLRRLLHIHSALVLGVHFLQALALVMGNESIIELT